MADRDLFPGVPQSPMPWQAALEAIAKRDRQRIRLAVASLVADRENRDTILSHLLRIVRESSDIVCSEVPHGIRPGEGDKYREIVAAVVTEQAAIQAILGSLAPTGSSMKMVNTAGYGCSHTRSARRGSRSTSLSFMRTCNTCRQRCGTKMCNWPSRASVSE